MSQWDLIRDTEEEVRHQGTEMRALAHSLIPQFQQVLSLIPQYFSASTLDKRKVTKAVEGLGFGLGFPDKVSTQLFSSL